MLHTLKSQDWFHPDGFPIAVESRDPQGPFPRHAHEFSEIVIITGGSGRHVVEGESWPLTSGDIFVIGGRRVHGYVDPKGLRLINVLFQPEKLRFELQDLTVLPGYHALFTLEPAWRKRHQFRSRLHLSPRELREVLAHVSGLSLELKERAPGFAFHATACFMQITGYLARCYGRAQHPDSRALLRIAEAIVHLETNFEQRVTLDELSGIAHMSKRSFIRTFHAAMGSSPIAYLLQLRVNRAAALLRNSDESVTDIAFRTGFGDSNYFARQFRKVTGVSPRAYRQEPHEVRPLTARARG